MPKSAKLSSREREVVQLIWAAKTDKEISADLSIAPDTVKRHLTNIFAKIGCSNRTELAIKTLNGSGCVRAFRCDLCKELKELCGTEAPGFISYRTAQIEPKGVKSVCLTCSQQFERLVTAVVTEMRSGGHREASE